MRSNLQNRRACVWLTSIAILGLGLSGCPEVDRDADSPPTIRALREHNIKRFTTLIESGADPDARDTSGRTALHLAASQNLADVAELLIAAGADVNAEDHKHETPLIQAAKYDGGQVIPLLLAAGAKLEHVALWTPLYWAIHEGSAATARILLDAGADFRKPDHDGNDALRLAAYAGKPDVIKALVQAGADLESTDEHGRTPLLCAARFGKIDAYRALVSLGANRDAQDNGHLSALDLAGQRGEKEMLRVIQEWKDEPEPLAADPAPVPVPVPAVAPPMPPADWAPRDGYVVMTGCLPVEFSHQLALSADGRHIINVSAGKLSAYRVDRDSDLHETTTLDDVRSFVATPDMQYVFVDAGLHSAVYRLENATGELIHIASPRFPGSVVACLPDGSRVLCLSQDDNEQRAGSCEWWEKTGDTTWAVMPRRGANISIRGDDRVRGAVLVGDDTIVLVSKSRVRSFNLTRGHGRFGEVDSAPLPGESGLLKHTVCLDCMTERRVWVKAFDTLIGLDVALDGKLHEVARFDGSGMKQDATGQGRWSGGWRSVAVAGEHVLGGHVLALFAVDPDMPTSLQTIARLPMETPSNIRISADGRTACVGFLGGPLTLWRLDPVRATAAARDRLATTIAFDPSGTITLQQAVDDAPDGACIVIGKGLVSQAGALILKDRNDLTLMGGQDQAPSLLHSIHIRNSRNIRLVSLEVMIRSAYAIQIENSSGVQVLDCDAIGGIDANLVAGLHIERCVVHDLTDTSVAAFRLGAGCKDVRLLGNRVYDNDHNRAGVIESDQLLAKHNWLGEGNKVVPLDLAVERG